MTRFRRIVDLLAGRERRPSAAQPGPKHAPHNATLLMGCGKFGMFANVHRVAEYARLAAADGRDFVVKWQKSPYLDPERQGDPWLYYFEPVFETARLGQYPQRAKPLYRDKVRSSANLFNPRLVPGVRDSMGLPPDRPAAHAVLDRFIRVNRSTQAFIDDFAANFFTRPVVGLHLRGPGRVHGGAHQMRLMLEPGGGVPYEHYFAAVDAALERHPDAIVFGCSDSLEAIRTIRDRYGERALFYPASRSEFGEMHDEHPENAGQTFSPYKLGLDVIVEAHLLARTEHFVHGNSNVANYVLARAPELPSTYVYAQVEARMIEAARATQVDRQVEKTLAD